MIRAVLDTNALASGILGILIERSVLGHILRRWRAGAFLLIVSQPILVESERTLRKPYFQRRLTEQQITAVLDLLRTEAMLQPITATASGAATHPEDDVILATAASARADYLVTGDGQLQRLGAHQGVTILSPRAFLDVLNAHLPLDLADQ